MLYVKIQFTQSIKKQSYLGLGACRSLWVLIHIYQYPASVNPPLLPRFTGVYLLYVYNHTCGSLYTSAAHHSQLTAQKVAPLGVRTAARRLTCGCARISLTAFFIRVLLCFSFSADGPVLLCSKSFWCSGEAGPKSWVLGGKARCVCGNISADHSRTWAKVSRRQATHRQFCVLFKYIPCRKFFATT